MPRAALVLLIGVACSSRDSRAPASAPPVSSDAPALTLVTADEPGERLTLAVTITDRAGAPLAADLHVYQTDDGGFYTPARAMDEPHARLSGRITTDAAGRYTLHTIRPGHYREAVTLDGVARHIPAHIHMDVRTDGHAERKLQVVFADDPELADPYWQAWARDLRQPIVPLTPGPPLTGTLTIAID